jgi:hypothetical protein
VIPLTDGLPGILKIDFTRCKRHSDVGNNDDKDRKTRFQQPNIDRCLDIDEPTGDTPPQKQSNAQQGPLEYGLAPASCVGAFLFFLCCFATSQLWKN